MCMPAVVVSRALMVTRTGLVSNISQCQITRIYAIVPVRSRKVSCARVDLFSPLGKLAGRAIYFADV